jgi:hypothetical protein
MSADDFFSRWSRNKAQAPAGPAAAPAPAAGPVAEAATGPAPVLPPPTLEDVAALGHDADFSRFVQPGVDEAVRRSAMKKLFTDPHFNVMDGLDIYIGDYNTFEPLPAAMLAMLVHAKPLLDPLAHLQQPAMKMLDRLEQLAQAAEDSPAAGEVQAPDDAEVEIIEQAVDNSQAMEHPVVNSADTPTDPVPPEDDHTI